MAADDRHPTERDVSEYVERHAPELDATEVTAFMAEHLKPPDETDAHLAWAVRVLRERGEGEFGGGLPVDRVVDEIRRRDR